MSSHKSISRKSTFNFFNKINDFLPHQYQNQQFEASFINRPSVKDTIEALGVPHAEIDCIFLNGLPVDFNYSLEGNEQIEVYPRDSICHGIHLQSDYPKNPKFIIDVNLGKLVPKLRLLGFDTLFENDYEDHEIVAISNLEQRIILTRDVGILKYNSIKFGYWVRSTKPHVQVEEVIREFKLKSKIKAFTRCSACNGKLSSIDKDEIIHQLEAKVADNFDDFTQCESCNKIYWRGSHVDKINKWIAAL